jgi:probable phosphoglycerate mutase
MIPVIVPPKGDTPIKGRLMPPSSWEPPPRRRLYLLRHGDVDYFDGAGKPVPPDNVPLNDAGRRQAEATARDFAEVPFDRIVCSGLPRTAQTAEIIVGGRNLVIETESALREIQPGKLRDLPAGDLHQHFVDVFTSSIDRTTRFLGGETFGALQDRVMPAFAQLLADASWRHLLMVAHGGVNRVVLAHCLGLGLEGIGVMEQDPCCVNLIDVGEGGRFVVRLVNHTCYNTAKCGLELTTMERLFLQFLGTP